MKLGEALIGRLSQVTPAVASPDVVPPQPGPVPQGHLPGGRGPQPLGPAEEPPGSDQEGETHLRYLVLTSSLTSPTSLNFLTSSISSLTSSSTSLTWVLLVVADCSEGGLLEER